MIKIIVTGPECCGKTSLCEALSQYLKIPFAEEYSRTYLNKLDRTYRQQDLLEIAKGQLKSEQKAAKQKLAILDTDLITIKIWSEYKYQSCEKWIVEQIQKQKKEIRFYLLCKPDIPWNFDPLRENPTDRSLLFELYKKELEQLQYPYFIVEGKDRTNIAIHAIQHYSCKLLGIFISLRNLEKHLTEMCEYLQKKTDGFD